MSCGCNTRDSYKDDGRGAYGNHHCVTDVISEIIRAQRRAHDAMEDTCLTSCERSIDDLLSPSVENRRKPKHNTIPFILFSKDSVKPFIGSGIVKEKRRSSNRHSFKCIESPIFRAKSFVDRDQNCVRLELLKPVGDRRHHNRGDSRPGSTSHHQGHRDTCNRHTVCDFFPAKDIEDFIATGICITVDLRCFCGITCLDPITPIRARLRDRDDNH